MTADTPQTEAGRHWVRGWHTHDGDELDRLAVEALTAAILSVEAEAFQAGEARAAALDQPDPHKPGEPHQYDLRCKVCGQLGVIRLSIDPTVEGEP